MGPAGRGDVGGRAGRAPVQAARRAGHRLAATSPFYQRRLAEAGVEPGATVTLDDLRSLPFTTKQDLWEQYPWGMLTVPREEVARVHASSGTGGRPTLSAYSRNDLALWAQVCARALGCAHADRGTTVQVSYGNPSCPIRIPQVGHIGQRRRNHRMRRWRARRHVYPGMTKKRPRRPKDGNMRST